MKVFFRIIMTCGILCSSAMLMGGSVYLGPEFFEVKSDFRTPAIAMSRPSAGGRIRALFLIPRFGSRDIVELGQRCDVDYEVVMFRDVRTLGEPLITGAEEKAMIDRLNAALRKKYDVIVIGNLYWEAIPEEQQYLLLQKVSEGTGLVYCLLASEQIPGMFEKLFTSVPVPMELQSPGETFDFRKLRHGRVMFKKGYGGVGHRFSILSKIVKRVDYENAMLQLIRGLYWASGKEFGQLSVRCCGDRGYELPEAKFPVEAALFNEDCSRIDGRTLSSGQKYRLPDLPGGKYFLMFREVDARQRIGRLAGFPLNLRKKERIESIVSDREYYRAGDRVILQVRANAAGEFRLKFCDNFGRVLFEKTSPDGKFIFTAPGYATIYCTARIELLRNGRILAADRLPVFVHHTEPDGFLLGSWVAAAGDYLGVLLGKRLAELGFDSAIWTASEANLRPMPSCGVFAGTNYSGYDRVRTPCLSSPQFLGQLKQKFARVMKDAERHQPIGITLGDEPSLSIRNVDVCVSPTCLEYYRNYLKKKYSSVENLNQAWKTHFADWKDIFPATEAEARKNGDYASWLTHRRAMDGVLAGYLKYMQNAGKPIRVGLEGIWHVRPTLGIDWIQACRSAGLIMPYCHHNHFGIEAVSSFASREALSGTWFGSYPAEIEDFYALGRKPWLMLLHNSRSICWYTPYSYTHSSNLMAGLLPDYRVSPNMAVSLKEIQYIKQGIDRVIFASQRDDNRVAVLYSPESMYFDTGTKYDTLLILLEDLGWNYRLIEAGQLQREKFDVLLLDHAALLSDIDVSWIRQFVAGGGKVVSIGKPGVRNEIGALRTGDILPGNAWTSLEEIPSAYLLKMPVVERRAIQEKVMASLKKAMPARRLLLKNSSGRHRGDSEVVFYQNKGFETAGILKRNYDMDSSRTLVELPEKRHVYLPRTGRYLGLTRRFEVELPDGPALIMVLSEKELRPLTVRGLKKEYHRGEKLSVTMMGKADQGCVRYGQLVMQHEEGGYRQIRNIRMSGGMVSLQIPLALNEKTGIWNFRLYDSLTGNIFSRKINIKE